MSVNLDVEWAGTLLALLAVLLIPVPILFYLYGARIRARSSFAIHDLSPPAPAPTEKQEQSASGDGEEDEREARHGPSVADKELETALSGEYNWVGTTYGNTKDQQPGEIDEWMARTCHGEN